MDDSIVPIVLLVLFCSFAGFALGTECEKRGCHNKLADGQRYVRLIESNKNKYYLLGTEIPRPETVKIIPE